MLLTALFIITILSVFFSLCAFGSALAVTYDNKRLRAYIAETAAGLTAKCNEAIERTNAIGDDEENLGREVKRLAELVTADYRSRAADAAFGTMLARTPSNSLPQA